MPPSATTRRNRAVQRHVIGPISQFPPGTKRQVMVGTRAVAVFNVDGRLYALRDQCPHQGASLSAGTLVSEIRAELPGHYRFDPSHKCIRCPWHGWEYDLETGQSYYDPEHDRVRAFEIVVESSETCQHAAPPGRQPGPFTAETVRVASEDDHVVLYV
jgi:nitrite reductase/ring-hydroxylating ferredoxin subunit